MSNFKVNHSARKGRKQVGDYILEKAIGFGAFSTVYEGSNVHSKLKVAVKSINLHRINVSEKHLSNLKQEIDILRKCRHSNIVQLLHTYQTSNHIYLIMQFCGGGDLHRFVQRNGKMTERDAQRFTIQFVEGLKYLHSLAIIHRDLKPQNILLSENSKNAIVRIADFGFARYKPTGHNMVDTMCGSPLYMAPEILKCNKYDSKVDLWSAGTIIYQMVTREPPFNGANHIQLLKNIESMKRIRFPSGLSEDCKDLIVRLLKRSPQHRISWDGLFNHPWLHPAVAITASSSPSSGGGHRVRTPASSKSPSAGMTSPKMGPRSDRGHSGHSRSDSGRKHKFPPPLHIHSNASKGNSIGNGASSPEAFIMIDSGPSSGSPSRGSSAVHNATMTPPAATNEMAMNSKLYLEFLGQCTKSLRDASKRYEFAQCLMKVGDVETSREHISSALLLYLRGLDVLETVIASVQSWIALYGASHRYFHRKFKRKRNVEQLLEAVDEGMTQSRADALSLQFKQLLLDSIRCYDDHWKRGEAIQTLCATQCLQFEVERGGNVDCVLFEFAVDIAQKSCSDVLLNLDGKEQVQSAQHKMAQSAVVLEYLMAVDSITDEDKREIRKYLDAMEGTLRVIATLK